MLPEIPSSRRRFSAWCRRSSTIRSPALSWMTSSVTSSHSGVAYSGWNPVSRYSRAPFSRNTLAFRAPGITFSNRYRATLSGLRRRWPFRVQVRPYSFSRPKIRRFTGPRAPLLLSDWHDLPRRAQELAERLHGNAPELALDLRAVEDGDLEVALAERLVLRDRQRPHAEPERLAERQPLAVVILEEPPDLVRLAAHRRIVVLVLDRAVVEDVVDFVLRAVRLGHLGHEHLDLERLDVLREDVPERLRVGVGERLGGHVAAAVRVSLDVRMTDAGDSQIFELVVFANAREGDPVVDLRDLVE